MERTFLKSPKHCCARCGMETSVSDLQWQNSILVCHRNDCVDTEYPALPQERDALVSAAASAAMDSDELKIDPKLTPEATPDEDSIIFNI